MGTKFLTSNRLLHLVAKIQFMGSLLLSFTKVRVVLSALSLKLWIWYDLLPFEMEQLRAAQMPALTQDRCFWACKLKRHKSVFKLSLPGIWHTRTFVQDPASQLSMDLHTLLSRALSFSLSIVPTRSDTMKKANRLCNLICVTLHHTFLLTSQRF